jgi:ABC-2 type transport system ATP-binding protein
VLLSSHLLGEVEHTVDRLVVIGAGKVVADGPIGALLAGDGVRVRAVDAGALAGSLQAAGLTVSAEGPALTVAGATAEQVGRIAAAGGHVLTDLRPADRGLEDVFFQLTA